MKPRNVLFLALGSWAAWQGGKMAFVALKMDGFTVAEFKGQLPLLTYGLLFGLAAFRAAVGVPVVFSNPAGGGLFAVPVAGSDHVSKSQHFFGRAADIKWPAGITREAAYKAACRCFSGVGVYPWGLHVDCRPDRPTGSPATWGRVYHADGTFTDTTAAAVLSSLPSGVV